MIKPTCRMCEKGVKFGGLLISPPDEHDTTMPQIVLKSHLCKHCYKIITDFIRKRKAINAIVPEYKIQDHDGDCKCCDCI